MKWLLTLSLLALLAACSKSDDAPDYKNRWIETTLRKDTITFPMGAPDASSPYAIKILNLNGRLEPYDSRHFTASYQLTMKVDSVEVVNMYSADYLGRMFYYRKQDNSIKMGNFYNRAELPDILEFEPLF